MESKNITRLTTAAGGALLLVGLASAPALAADYPPENPSSNKTTTDTSTPVGNSASSETPAYTGAATTIALAAGVIALGAGAGLLVASRRRREN